MVSTKKSTLVFLLLLLALNTATGLLGGTVTVTEATTVTIDISERGINPNETSDSQYDFYSSDQRIIFCHAIQ